jgi:AcrR family transcriptional regulator
VNRRSAKVSKEKIMEAARNVFSTYGYRRANMRRIAKAAGMSVGGLYLYFENKEELFVKIVEEKVEALLAELDRLEGTEEDPASLIRGVVRKIIEHAKKNRDFILIFTNMEKARVGKRIGRKVSSKIKDLIERVIKLGIAKGIFRMCGEKEVASTINSALIGHIISVVIEGKHTSNPEICSELFLEGLMKRGGI